MDSGKKWGCEFFLKNPPFKAENEFVSNFLGFKSNGGISEAA
jgi:hypothetical protein